MRTGEITATSHNHTFLQSGTPAEYLQPGRLPPFLAVVRSGCVGGLDDKLGFCCKDTFRAPKTPYPVKHKTNYISDSM